MLKFEKIAKIGDIIRAYDFKGNTDCFVEGVVFDINSEAGYKAFVIRCTKDIMGRVGEIVYVPMEVSFLEYDSRIVNLTA